MTQLCNYAVNYAINKIHEKAFRSDLSTQIKKTSFLTNYYELLFAVIYLYLVALLHFSMIAYDGVGVN